MKHLKLMAAALALIVLGGCVGFIVPLPASTSSQQPDREERR